MRITYYGTRGSIPVSGRDFCEFGGNTTCVLIEEGKTVVIIDAGTGIRNCGNELLQRKIKEIHILFTHTHWDHIQGFPFFGPAYSQNHHIFIYGETKFLPRSRSILDIPGENEDWQIQKALSWQQFFMFFPVPLEQMPSKLVFFPIKPGEAFFVDDLEILPIALYHPNGSLGFRFSSRGKVFVFCTDVEHNTEISQKLSDFAKGADIFAYDSQYTPEEYEQGRKGWGHSTYKEGARIATIAEVKSYHMIHHDPSHNDAKILEMEEEAKKIFPSTLAVREKNIFDI